MMVGDRLPEISFALNQTEIGVAFILTLFLSCPGHSCLVPGATVTETPNQVCICT